MVPARELLPWDEAVAGAKETATAAAVTKKRTRLGMDGIRVTVIKD
jgi:hypothetical protein